MKATQASVPGKIILFGEHAVVYGRPAIAAPLTRLRARAVVEDSSEAGIRLIAPDIGRDYQLADARDNDPFARSVLLVMEAAEFTQLPDLKISVTSEIPIASGMGSGAAMAAAVIRALCQHLNLSALNNDERISKLTYEVEKLLHGHPSGIDNTVVAYEKPVYFVRQQPDNHIETLEATRDLLFLIADSGIASSTKEVVSDVRRLWLADKKRLEAIFDGCGTIASAAKKAIFDGDIEQLGRLMNQNQELLIKMSVSSVDLDSLVEAARRAGALGAKLSGAGRGGNMIALVEKPTEEAVAEALIRGGAKSIFTSQVEA